MLYDAHTTMNANVSNLCAFPLIATYYEGKGNVLHSTLKDSSSYLQLGPNFYTLGHHVCGFRKTLHSPESSVRNLGVGQHRYSEVRWGKKAQVVDDRTGCKQANGSVSLSTPLLLKVKPKVSTPNMSVIIPHCAGKLFKQLQCSIGKQSDPGYRSFI